MMRKLFLLYILGKSIKKTFHFIGKGICATRRGRKKRKDRIRIEEEQDLEREQDKGNQFQCKKSSVHCYRWD